MLNFRIKRCAYVLDFRIKMSANMLNFRIKRCAYVLNFMLSEVRQRAKF